MAAACLARRKSAAQPRILRAAGIELDPLQRTVTRDGQHVDVSPVIETIPGAGYRIAGKPQITRADPRPACYCYCY